MSAGRRLIRIVFTALHGVRIALRAVTGLRGFGVHAVPLTAEGRVVLVRLTYAPGWRLPGGGRKRGEAPVEAMLRELREEIGLLGHGEIEALDVARLGGDSDDRSALFLVRDVRYRPRRSLEIDEVREFNPDRLPDEAAAWTRRIVDGLGGLRPPRGAGADG